MSDWVPAILSLCLVLMCLFADWAGALVHLTDFANLLSLQLCCFVLEGLSKRGPQLRLQKSYQFQVPKTNPKLAPCLAQLAQRDGLKASLEASSWVFVAFLSCTAAQWIMNRSYSRQEVL